MKVYCPGCDVRWAQRGNQTGHCSACHRTFGSLDAFDAHQSIDDGVVTCTAPDLLKSRDGAARFRAKRDAEGALVWHGAKTRDWGVAS